MTVTAGPVNLQAGLPLSIQCPQTSGIYPSAVVLYNTSPVQSNLNIGQNFDFLNPNLAAAWPIPAQGNAVQLRAISPLATNTYLGVVSAVFYFPSDGSPVGFPVQIPQFPGGYDLIVASTISGDATLLGQATPGVSYPFSVPPGTSSLLFPSFLFTVQNDQPGGALLVGVESGTVYYTFPGSAQNNEVPATTVSIVGAVDSEFHLTATRNNNPILNLVTLDNSGGIYASSGPGTPTFASEVVAGSFANGAEVLPAPGYGANYVFGWDASVAPVAQGVGLGTAAGTLAALIAVANVTIAEGAGSATIAAPIRVTGALYKVDCTSSETDDVILRWAPGP